MSGSHLARVQIARSKVTRCKGKEPVFFNIIDTIILSYFVVIFVHVSFALLPLLYPAFFSIIFTYYAKNAILSNGIKVLKYASKNVPILILCAFCCIL